MKILTECGLVVTHSEGRERFCEANLRSLAEVSQWVERYRAFWTEKLDALEIFLNNSTETGKRPDLTARTKNEKRRRNSKS